MAVAKLVFVLVVSMMSVGAVGQTMCSYEELMQAYKGDNKQKIRQCRELHERYGPSLIAEGLGQVDGMGFSASTGTFALFWSHFLESSSRTQRTEG